MRRGARERRLNPPRYVADLYATTLDGEVYVTGGDLRTDFAAGTWVYRNATWGTLSGSPSVWDAAWASILLGQRPIQARIALCSQVPPRD